MLKKIIAVFCVAVAIITCISISFIAFADNVTWDYNNENKTLTISGVGDMADYDNEFSMPWYEYIDVTQNVVIEEGVTSVGAYAFSGADNLVCVSIADSVTAICDYAFSSCPKLLELEFGANILLIDDVSFSYDGLTVKKDFVLKCYPATYALHYAYINNINFECESVKCGKYNTKIVSKSMQAVYPYTAKVSGTFRFYSTGNHDTYGYLYDSEKKLKTSNDDASSTNTNFSLTFDLEKGKTYYFVAKIYNSSLLGSFSTYIESVDYTVSGSIFASLNPKGEQSSILVDEALIDGSVSGGKFTYHITQPKTIHITAGNNEIDYTFSPDNGDVQNITLMMCDVNNDHIVNGKDCAIMHRTGSKYESLFTNFINFRC